MLFKMAFRNIFRHTKRTLLTLVTIIFGIFFGIAGDGLNSGMKWQVADIYKNSMTSDFTLYKAGFFNLEEDNEPLEYLYDFNTAKNLLTDKNIKAYSEKLLFPGSITNSIEELKVKFLGITPEHEEKVFNRSSKLVSGTFLKGGSEEVVIGKGIADSLGLKTGDSVTITGRTAAKAINGYDCTVAGIISTGNPIVDNFYVFMKLDFAQSFADCSGINGISVKTNSSSEKKLNSYISKNITSLNKSGLEVITWKDEIADLLALVNFRGKIFSVITAVILIMAAAGIMNTMLMAMLERKKEIGIMCANGMSEKNILLLFTLEGGIIGAIGSTIAFVAGFIFVSYLQKHGIPFSAESTGIGNDFPINDRLYLYFEPLHAAVFYFVGIAVSTLSALYPAAKAVKLEPVEAIRG